MHRVSLAFSAILGVATVASAHPGHGHSTDTVSASHYMTEPLHAGALIAALLVSATTVAWSVRSKGPSTLRSLPLRRRNVS